MEFKVGQEVYVFDRYTYHIAMVDKITPSGMIDVRWPQSGQVTRFNADFHRRGDNYYSAWSIDTKMSFEDRTKYLARKKILDEAATAYNRLEINRISAYSWDGGKQEIVNRLEQLQTEIDKIRKHLEQVKDAQND